MGELLINTLVDKSNKALKRKIKIVATMTVVIVQKKDSRLFA